MVLATGADVRQCRTILHIRTTHEDFLCFLVAAQGCIGAKPNGRIDPTQVQPIQPQN